MVRKEVQGLFHTFGLAMSPRSLRNPDVNYCLNGVYFHLEKKKEGKKKGRGNKKHREFLTERRACV